MEKKQHYKRFFTLCALFGLITSSVVYASESANAPFPTVSGEPVTISDILPDLPVIVSPDEDPAQENEEPSLEPVSDPVEPIEEEPVDEPSGSISENTVSEDTVSNDGVMGEDLEEATPGSLEDNQDDQRFDPVVININDVNADNYYKFSLSADNVKIEYLDSISRNLAKINEDLKKYEKVQKNLVTVVSGVSRNETAYQKGVLECLLSIAYSLSGNEAVSSDEISISAVKGAFLEIMSANVISENEAVETVSENEPEETVSDDQIESISEDVVSISKGDLDQLHADNEQLHEDLRAIFYVGIFGVIFLAMIAAGNLEQIIFKRLRG